MGTGDNVFPLGKKPLNGMPYRCMIVDDSRTMRMLLRQILLSLHFEVCGEAESAADALKLIKEQGCKPDILFADIEMPGMTGIEMVRELRAVYKDIRIIMVSGHTEEDTVRQLVGLNVNGFIIKPFDRETVVGKMAVILNRKDYLEKAL